MKKIIASVFIIIYLLFSIVPNYIYAATEYNGLYKKTINTILKVGKGYAGDNFSIDRAMDKYGTITNQTSEFKEWSDAVIKIMDKGLPDSKDIIDTSGKLAYTKYNKNKSKIAEMTEFLDTAYHGMTAMITSSTTYGNNQMDVEEVIDPQTGVKMVDKVAYFCFKYSGVRYCNVVARKTSRSCINKC